MLDLYNLPEPGGLGHAYFTHLLKYKNRTAQIDALTGETDTYHSLLQRSVRTAMALKEKGITRDDIVMICSFNHLNSCVPYIATLFLGVKVAALDPTLSFKDTVHLLKQVTPKLLFVVPEAVETIEDAMKEVCSNIEMVVFGDTKKYIPFSNFLLPRDGEGDFRPSEVQNLRETAAILFSSGTSGLPKGICLSHHAFLGQISNLWNLGCCFDNILVFTSLYWITASVYLGVSIMHGVKRIVVPNFDQNTVWRTIVKYKPTFIFVAPVQMLAIYDAGLPDDMSNCSIKDMMIGGGPVSKEQMMSVRKAFPKTRVFQTYGQTEVTGCIAGFRVNDSKELHLLETKVASSGTRVPGISYKVVDLETEEILGPNQPGEIRVKTDFQLNGYYRVDSSEAWDSQGWFKTGDVGYYDEDFCFYIVDRIKEMLKFQSWHVPPASIESVLLTHPDVATAAVIGIPHESDGDHPMAVIVLKQSSDSITPEEIKEYVDKRVDDRQRLRGGVKIIKRIPTTVSGKIKRKMVRDMILQGSL